MAAKYAIKVFPFDHPGARYVSLLASADHHVEVKELGKEGIQFPQQKDNIASMVSHEGSPLPSFSKMLTYVEAQTKSRPLKFGVAGQYSVLSFPQETFTQILRFLRLTMIINSDPDVRVDPFGTLITPLNKAKLETFLDQTWRQTPEVITTYSNFLLSSLDPKLCEILFFFSPLFQRKKQEGRRKAKKQSQELK